MLDFDIDKLWKSPLNKFQKNYFNDVFIYQQQRTTLLKKSVEYCEYSESYRKYTEHNSIDF